MDTCSIFFKIICFLIKVLDGINCIIRTRFVRKYWLLIWYFFLLLSKQTKEMKWSIHSVHKPLNKRIDIHSYSVLDDNKYSLWIWNGMSTLIFILFFVFTILDKLGLFRFFFIEKKGDSCLNKHQPFRYSIHTFRMFVGKQLKRFKTIQNETKLNKIKEKLITWNINAIWNRKCVELVHISNTRVTFLFCSASLYNLQSTICIIIIIIVIANVIKWIEIPCETEYLYNLTLYSFKWLWVTLINATIQIIQ